MPNLCDSLMRKQFVEKLTKCEQNLEAFDLWSQKFIEDIRERFDTREQAEDLGITPWSPSVKQWNQLSEMAERV